MTMLPEEEELSRLELEQANLQDQVASGETMLETIKSESLRFQHRYFEVVGHLYAQLDELDAHIARLELSRKPHNLETKAKARDATQRARDSEAELDRFRSKSMIREISPALKQSYRHAVKLMHPDLATTEHERRRRTELITMLNLAYERGDKDAIDNLIDLNQRDPEAILGEDTGSRIVRAIRRVAQLRRRLTELSCELEAHQQTEIFRLKETTESTEARGLDPLADVAKRLRAIISQREATIKSRFAGP